MNQIMSWICLLSVSFLILDIMVYLCKDIVKIFHEAEIATATNVKKARKTSTSYSYNHKIAK